MAYVKFITIFKSDVLGELFSKQLNRDVIISQEKSFVQEYMVEWIEQENNTKLKDAFVSQIERFIRIMTLTLRNNKNKTNKQWYVG